MWLASLNHDAEYACTRHAALRAAAERNRLLAALPARPGLLSRGLGAALACSGRRLTRWGERMQASSVTLRVPYSVLRTE